MNKNDDTYYDSLFEDPNYSKTAFLQSDVNEVNKLMAKSTLPSELITKMAKVKGDVYPKIVSIKYETDMTTPFHYNATIMSKVSAGKFEFTDRCVNSIELNKIADEVAPALASAEGRPNTDYLWINPKEKVKEKKENKPVSKTGNYNLRLKDVDPSEAGVFYLPKPLWGSLSGKKSLAISYPYPRENQESFWAYDEIRGIKTDDNGDVNVDMTVAEAGQSLTGKNVVFKGGELFTSPYSVIDYDSYRIGQNREIVNLLKVRSEMDNAVAYLWLNADADDVVKVNKEKLLSSEYRIIDQGHEDIYLVPSNYKMYLLSGKRADASDERISVEKSLTKKASDSTIIYKVEMKDKDFYSAELGDNNYDGISKRAADMLSEYVLGNDVNFIDGEYYQVEKLGESKSPLNISFPSGDWIKLAEHLSKNAELNSLIEGIAGVEYLKGSTANTTAVQLRVKSLINEVGQLLIKSRVGQGHLSEDVVKKGFDALVDIYLALRGQLEA